MTTLETKIADVLEALIDSDIDDMARAVANTVLNHFAPPF